MSPTYALSSVGIRFDPGISEVFIPMLMGFIA